MTTREGQEAIDGSPAVVVRTLRDLAKAGTFHGRVVTGGTGEATGQGTVGPLELVHTHRCPAHGGIISCTAMYCRAQPEKVCWDCRLRGAQPVRPPLHLPATGR
jgi:hypothetical protein